MNYPRLVLAAVSALITFFAWGFLTKGWLLHRFLLAWKRQNARVNDYAPSGATTYPTRSGGAT